MQKCNRQSAGCHVTLPFCPFCRLGNATRRVDASPAWLRLHLHFTFALAPLALHPGFSVLAILPSLCSCLYLHQTWQLRSWESALVLPTRKVSARFFVSSPPRGSSRPCGMNRTQLRTQLTCLDTFQPCQCALPASAAQLRRESTVKSPHLPQPPSAGHDRVRDSRINRQTRKMKRSSTSTTRSRSRHFPSTRFAMSLYRVGPQPRSIRISAPRSSCSLMVS